MCNGITIDEIRNNCKPVNIEQRLEEEKYSNIVQFKKITSRKQLTDICNTIKKHEVFEYSDDMQKHLWSFYGKVDSKWFCIEVGSSDNILEEICGIAKLMFEESKEVEKRSVLHGDMVIYRSYSYVDKNCYKYRYMNSLFDEFWWIENNVDKFQEGNTAYEKTNYAEVKCAVDDKALAWNPAPSTKDSKGRINCEREILNNVFGIPKQEDCW